MEKVCKSEPFKALMLTSKNIQDQIRLEISKNNLNLTEFSVLETLYLKGRQNIHQIGKSVLISSGSMTYVIDKLEKKELLQRTECPEDRRALYITLTEKGEQFMTEMMPQFQDFISEMFTELSHEDGQTLIQLLKKIKI